MHTLNSHQSSFNCLEIHGQLDHIFFFLTNKKYVLVQFYGSSYICSAEGTVPSRQQQQILPVPAIGKSVSSQHFLLYSKTRTATPGMHISIYQICTASGVLIYVIYNLLDFELDPDEDIQSDHYIYLQLYKRDACMRDN